MTDSDLHAKVDALAARLDSALSALGVPAEPVKAGHAAEPDRMTATDVHATKFAVTRIASGYSIEQVDAFMDRTAAEIVQLTRERDEARRERDALR